MEYPIDYGEITRIPYQGKVYCAYVRVYNTGEFDLEVFPEGNEEEEVSEEVHQYCWDFLEHFGRL